MCLEPFSLFLYTVDSYRLQYILYLQIQQRTYDAANYGDNGSLRSPISLSPVTPSEYGTPRTFSPPPSVASTQLVTPPSLSSPETSDDGSMRSIIIKVESGIPAKFSILSAWRAQIMDSIATQQMSPSVRNAVVRDLVVHMYSYGKRPLRKFCAFAARQLVLKYPCMRDACGTGYVSYFYLYVYILATFIYIVGVASAYMSIYLAFI